MNMFSLHLRPHAGSDEWSFTVRDHTGAALLSRRFFPDRLSSQRSGEAAMRQLADRATAFNAWPNREGKPMVKPNKRPSWKLRAPFFFREREAKRRTAVAANNNRAGELAAVSWRVAGSANQVNSRGGLTLQDTLKAANAARNAPNGYSSAVFYDWCGHAAANDIKATKSA